jgi:CDP-diglyceride synthetase
MQTEGAHIVRLVEQPAPEVTVVDVIVGALGIAGVMTLAAVLLGLALGWIFILRSRRRGIEAEHPPSIQVN